MPGGKEQKGILEKTPAATGIGKEAHSNWAPGRPLPLIPHAR